MKNLKRVLSLALSGVMLVGMMAMSASAVNAEDFTDADEITHTEAVSISTALKIIDGKDDGSFDPNGNVTRGQMAKMITRAMFGGEDPVLGLPTTPTFTDVPGSRWDATYIEYCANNEIINGRGDGTFDPEGNVTGTEAAKMLLTALGYKADIYGLVGPDWAITTNSLANQTKVALYDGLKGLDPTQAFTRDQVAQMIYNTLNAETMEMLPDMSITNGQVTYKYQPSGRTLLYDKYGAVRVEGYVTANSFSNNADSMKGKTSLYVTNDDELNDMIAGFSGKNAQTLEVESGADVFRRNVVAYVKPASANKTNLSKGTVISDVILDTESYTEYSTTSGFNAGETDKLSKWIDGKGLSGMDSSAEYFLDYAKVTGTALDAAFAASDPTDYKNTRGTKITVIDIDQDGDVDFVLKETSEFGQVTKWSTKDKGSVTVKTAENIHNFSNKELDEVVAYEGIAVDDYVNVTKVSDTWYVTKAEKVEGELEYYKRDGVKTTIKVNGDSYNTVADAKAYAGTDNLKGIRSDIAIIGVEDENVTFYLDAFGYAVAGTTDAATEYLFVGATSWSNIASSQNNGTLTAYVYLSDGTSGSYVVNKIDNAKAVSGDEDSIHGTVCKYSITSDGKLNLTTLSTGVGGTDANSETVKYNRTLSTLQIASDAKQFVTEDTIVYMVTLDSKTDNTADVTVDSVKVYSEKNAPSMDYAAHSGKSGAITNGNADAPEFYPGAITVATLDDAGNPTKNLDVVVFVNNGTSVDNDWIYLISYAGSVGKGTMYNAVVNGEVVEITTDDKHDRDNLTVPGAFKYSEDNGIYSIGTPYAHVQIGEVTLADSKSVVLDNSFEAKIDNDTVTALLDGADTEVDVNLTKGDIVAVVHDNGTDYKTAKGIFILAEYDSTAHKVVHTTAAESATSGVDYDIAKVSGSTATVAQAKAMFTVSGGAKIYLVANGTTVTNGTTTWAGLTEVTTLADGTKYDMYIVSADADAKATDGEYTKLVVMTEGAAASSATPTVAAKDGKDSLSIATDGTAGKVALEVTVTGDNGGTLRYEWAKTGDDTFVSTDAAKIEVNAAGTYTCTVTNTEAGKAPATASAVTFTVSA